MKGCLPWLSPCGKEAQKHGQLDTKLMVSTQSTGKITPVMSKEPAILKRCYLEIHILFHFLSKYNLIKQQIK